MSRLVCALGLVCLLAAGCVPEPVRVPTEVKSAAEIEPGDAATGWAEIPAATEPAAAGN